MTTQQQARETMYQAFVTAWGSTTAYTFDNEKFDPPVGTPWVRMAVIHQIGNQESLGSTGNRKFSREGVIVLQLFAPAEAGMRTLDGHVDTARAIFEGVTLTGQIRCTDASVREIGPNDGWYQVNIEIEFAYEEVK